MSRRHALERKAAALLLCGLGGLATLGCSGCEQTKADEPPPAAPAAPPGELQLGAPPPFLKLAPVQIASDAGIATATGKVAFNEDKVSRVGAPVNGRVTALLVQPGDRVKKGQPLIDIASPDVDAAVSDLVAAEADLAVTRKNLDRQKRLFAEQAVAAKDVQQAESDETKAEAGAARARARLEVLGIDPARAAAHATRYSLRSPLDGTVVERPALQGMEVRSDAGQPLVTVADLSTLWVIADVYERDLGSVKVGQLATVHVPAYPEAFSGKVVHVGDLVDPTTRTVKIRIELPNQDGRLKPEMFAKVTLQGVADAGGAPVLSVPSDAVVSDGDSSAVIVAVGHGRFQKRTIEVGPEQDGRVRVLSGLSPGEKVVVEGALFLKQEIEDR